MATITLPVVSEDKAKASLLPYMLYNGATRSWEVYFAGGDMTVHIPLDTDVKGLNNRDCVMLEGH